VTALERQHRPQNPRHSTPAAPKPAFIASPIAAPQAALLLLRTTTTTTTSTSTTTSLHRHPRVLRRWQTLLARYPITATSSIVQGNYCEVSAVARWCPDDSGAGKSQHHGCLLERGPSYGIHNVQTLIVTEYRSSRQPFALILSFPTSPQSGSRLS
jgi:hypothetical protein